MGPESAPAPAFSCSLEPATRASALTVNYSLAGSATNGMDYLLPTNSAMTSLTIPIGATSASLMIAPTTTTNVAVPKTVTLTLSTNGTYAVGAPSIATAIIGGNVLGGSSIQVTGSGATLSWPSTNGAVYRIAYKNSLTDPVWSYMATSITASGSRTSWTDTSHQPQRYFLIIQTH